MFLQKLQNLPSGTKKIIVWLVAAAVGLILIILWIGSIPGKLAAFQGKEFIEKLNLPRVGAPTIEIPKDEIKKKAEELKEMIKQAEQTK